jgi:hypothetical protein
MSMALLLEVFYYNCEYDKISFLINSIDFNVFFPKEFSVPITLKGKIVSEACATKFRGKLFTLADCGSNLIFGDPTLFHTLPGIG